MCRFTFNAGSTEAIAGKRKLLQLLVKKWVHFVILVTLLFPRPAFCVSLHVALPQNSIYKHICFEFEG